MGQTHNHVAKNEIWSAIISYQSTVGNILIVIYYHTSICV